MAFGGGARGEVDGAGVGVGLDDDLAVAVEGVGAGNLCRVHGCCWGRRCRRRRMWPPSIWKLTRLSAVGTVRLAAVWWTETATTADIFAVGADGGAVGGEKDGSGGAGGFDFGLQLLAVAGTFREKDAGGVFHFPIEFAVGLHGLFAEALVVEEEFDLVTVAVDADLDGLAFFAGPVPVRDELEDGFVGPPCAW